MTTPLASGNDESFSFLIVSTMSPIRHVHNSTRSNHSDTGEQLANRTANAPLLRYVDSMRTHGHRAARIDPLDIMQREEVAALDPTRYGLEDPSATYDVNGIVWTRPISEAQKSEKWTLEEISRHLRAVYVGRIAYEYMHSHSKTERLWFSHLLESNEVDVKSSANTAQKKRLHGLLARSEVFDQFLQAKFPNLKRYGLEGGESMLPALDALFASASLCMFFPIRASTSADLIIAEIEHIILAMPHRGRLNLLTDLLQYNPTALFHKIKGNSEIPLDLGATGDVISHLSESPKHAGRKLPL
jgi:probable 2-oxoglutarate dehydrogenase E1 component DHKTD1